MLCAHAMVDATEPILQVAEDEVDDRHELFGHLGVVSTPVEDSAKGRRKRLPPGLVG